MLGDNDGQDFDFNQVGWGFRNNFFTFSDSDFIDNIIGNDFNQNLIHYGFAKNVIGNNFDIVNVLPSLPTTTNKVDCLLVFLDSTTTSFLVF